MTVILSGFADEISDDLGTQLQVLAAAYPRLAPYLEYVQVKDALTVTGAVVSAGEGDGQVRLTLAALDEAGFAGFVSLERTWRWPGGSVASAGQRISPGPAWAGPGVGRWALGARRQRVRLTAESTARMEALVVSASTPTPHRVRPSISHST
jgi:sugar phosphate isomerase/epimerase